MLFVGLLLLTALPVQGNLELTLNQAVYSTHESGRQLEIAYDIPHTSLAFLRTDTGYTAGFRVGVDLLDRRGDPVSGDSEERRVSVTDYDLTVDRDVSMSGAVTLDVPAGAHRVRLEVQDLSSRRRASAAFTLAEGSLGLRLQFLRAGDVSPVRVYELADTLEVLAEVLDRPGPDSIRFSARSGRLVAFARTVAVEESAGRMLARLVEPLEDSLGRARFPAGDYQLEATGIGGPERLRAQAGWRFRVPFYYDDAAWRDKVDRLIWVATHEQMRELRGLDPEERERAWRSFWDELDPASAPGNVEREEQYFERIRYADEHFGRGDRGYRSDRGQVYVKLGPPDQRDVRPFEIDAHAYEVWHYYSLGLTFVFVDRYGFGEYVLDGPRRIP